MKWSNMVPNKSKVSKTAQIDLKWFQNIPIVNVHKIDKTLDNGQAFLHQDILNQFSNFPVLLYAKPKLGGKNNNL